MNSSAHATKSPFVSSPVPCSKNSTNFPVQRFVNGCVWSMPARFCSDLNVHLNSAKTARHAAGLSPGRSWHNCRHRFTNLSERAETSSRHALPQPPACLSPLSPALRKIVAISSSRLPARAPCALPAPAPASLGRPNPPLSPMPRPEFTSLFSPKPMVISPPPSSTPLTTLKVFAPFALSPDTSLPPTPLPTLEVFAPFALSPNTTPPRPPPPGRAPDC